jgi:putative flippase GtrA
MKEIGFKILWADKRIRFLIIGGLNTAVGFLVYPTLYYLIADVGFGYMTLLFISQLICTNFSFITNKSMVFRSNKNYFIEYFKYNTFQIIVVVVNLLVLPLCVEVFEMNPVVAQTVFTGSVVVISYLWHSKVTFNRN